MTQYQGDQTVTVGEWFVTWLIMLIPIANIVMMFVWAFGSGTKPSKANFFKFALILLAISIVLGILLSIAGVLTFNAFGDYYY